MGDCRAARSKQHQLSALAWQALVTSLTFEQVLLLSQLRVDVLQPRDLLLFTRGVTQDAQLGARLAVDQVEVQRVKARHRLLQRHVVHLQVIT